jgi:hypothetical protein
MARKKVVPVTEEASSQYPVRRGRECDREWHDTSIPAHPKFAMLCAQSILMWTSGADPQEIADWLETKQGDCPVSLRDQIFAVRGLGPYRRGGALDGFRLSTVVSESTIAPQMQEVQDVSGGPQMDAWELEV